MKLVKVKDELYILCEDNGVNEELMLNEAGRPCVLIIQLSYKGNLRDFVVPLRSNISPKTPPWQYFNLPPNSKTKPKHHHGIHYIKMFPIHKYFIDTYLTDCDKYYDTLLNFINKNEKRIVSECQNYLSQCELGKRHFMTPNIDGILNVIDNYGTAPGTKLNATTE